MNRVCRNILYVVIILTGLLQSIGYLTGIKELRGLGMASASSPLPIVFTQVKGVETFALDFTLHLKTDKGETSSIHLEPPLYSKLEGPYNRRNVYGAAFAYGPVLPDSIRNTILQYAFCTNGKLLREMNIPNTATTSRIEVKEKTKGRNRVWNYEIKCTQ